VTFTLDEKKREVEAPPDLLKALKRVAGARVSRKVPKSL
jgi:hypothetical protein